MACCTGVSFDGGQTWSQTAAKFTRCSGGNASNGGDYERASDAWASFSPNGTAHQISISFAENDVPSSVLVSRSTDGGKTWSDPITLIRDADPNVLNDKESITADPLDSNYVYAVWDRLDTPDSQTTFGPTKFARSTDNGQTWEPTRTIYDPGLNAQTIGNQIVVLPNGDLVDLFTLITNEDTTGNAYIAIIRSTDKGQTWSQQPIIINTLGSIGVTDLKTQEQVRTGDILPDIAVDQRSGTLSVVWQDARFSGFQRDGIVFSKSTDGGLTWSSPVQVNRVTQTQAFTAAVDIAVDGAIGVTYYDFRNDTSDPNTLLTDYWFALSYDGGTTWRESHVAGPFDMRTAPLTSTGFFVGDYEGLTHIGALFEVMFVQANSGNTNNRTDVFSTLEYNGDMVYTANSTLPSGGSTNSGPQKFGPEPLRKK